MRIDGRLVHLEGFAESHLHDPRYLTWLRDRTVMRYIGRDEYFKPFEFSMVENHVRSLWANRLCSFWAVHTLDDGAFIGTFKINFGDAAGEATRSADIGVMIGERVRWGRGFATGRRLRARLRHAACAQAHGGRQCREPGGAVGLQEDRLRRGGSIAP
jgi:Acetyltransferase (GNAT) domain